MNERFKLILFGNILLRSSWIGDGVSHWFGTRIFIRFEFKITSCFPHFFLLFFSFFCQAAWKIPSRTLRPEAVTCVCFPCCGTFYLPVAVIFVVLLSVLSWGNFMLNKLIIIDPKFHGFSISFSVSFHARLFKIRDSTLMSISKPMVYVYIILINSCSLINLIHQL